jgi:hypothetical protein
VRQRRTRWSLVLLAGLAACGVVIALEILSIPWSINVLAWRNAVAVSGGVMTVGRTSANLPYDWGTPSWQVRRRENRSLYLGFASGRNVSFQGTVTYYFPIWPLLLPGACLVAAAFWRNRNRTRTIPTSCPKCGYDLTGLREPRCPECGTPFDPSLLVGPNARETKSGKR